MCPRLLVPVGSSGPTPSSVQPTPTPQPRGKDPRVLTSPDRGLEGLVLLLVGHPSVSTGLYSVT